MTKKMGCICAKQSNNVHDYVPEKEKYVNEVRTTLRSSKSAVPPANIKENGMRRGIERPKSGPQRVNGTQTVMYRVASVPHSAKAEQIAAGWPSWLSSVAGEAVHGWTPRSPDSYQKLNKVCILLYFAAILYMNQLLYMLSIHLNY